MTLALLVEGYSYIYFEGTYQIEMLKEMGRTKPPQAGLKNKSFEKVQNLHGSFELQSAPNLHRDKKTKVLNFKVHRDKKTKVLNFKVRQTCTGTKKHKF